MKTIQHLLLLGAVSISATAFSQKISFGITGGATFGSGKSKVGKEKTSGSIAGFTAGILVIAAISPISVSSLV